MKFITMFLDVVLGRCPECHGTGKTVGLADTVTSGDVKMGFPVEIPCFCQNGR